MFENGFRLTKDFPEKPIIHHKNSRKNKHLPKVNEYEFHWTINGNTGLIIEPNTQEFEVFMHPKKDIGFGISSEYVLEILNGENVFDFEYVPEELDELEIFEKTPLTPYLLFSFQNGGWIAEHSCSLYKRTRKHTGYVKPV